MILAITRGDERRELSEENDASSLPEEFITEIREKNKLRKYAQKLQELFSDHSFY